MCAFQYSISLYLMSSTNLPNIAGLVCFLVPFLLSPALIWDNGPSLHSCRLTFLPPWIETDIPTWIHPTDDRIIARTGLGFVAFDLKRRILRCIRSLPLALSLTPYLPWNQHIVDSRPHISIRYLWLDWKKKHFTPVMPSKLYSPVICKYI